MFKVAGASVTFHKGSFHVLANVMVNHIDLDKVSVPAIHNHGFKKLNQALAMRDRILDAKIIDIKHWTATEA